MTSLHGYMDGSYNYQNLLTKTTIDPGRIVHDNTILHALFTTKECAPFLLWVRELDRLCGKFNSPNAVFTLFIPTNIAPPDDVDLYNRQQVVERHLFTVLFPFSLLQSSPGIVLKENCANQTIRASSCNGAVTLTNLHGPNGNTTTVLKKLNVGKSILYLIDSPL